MGQERAKRALASGLYRHYLLLLDAAGWPGRCVLPAGTNHARRADRRGKTLLIQTLAKYLDVPFAYASATTLVSEGYVGKKPEDLLSQLLEAAGGDIDRAQQGIILLDEIDKLKRNDDS